MHVAVLVPYRDEPSQNRASHLRILCAELPAVLSAAAAAHRATFTVYVGHAVHDGAPFARGRTLNALFALCMQHTPQPTRIVLHDVDLLPDAARARAYFDEFGLPTCALARAGSEYERMTNYIGGIFALDPAVFAAVNGFPNEMAGWGGEDDAMFDRLHAAGIGVAVTDAGRVHNMELSAETAGTARARDTHACPRDTRRRLRAAWKAHDPSVTGAAELCFAAAPAAVPPDVPAHVCVRHVSILAPVHVLPPWTMRFSATSGMPYFHNADTGTRTFVPPPPPPLLPLKITL